MEESFKVYYDAKIQNPTLNTITLSWDSAVLLYTHDLHCHLELHKSNVHTETNISTARYQTHSACNVSCHVISFWVQQHENAVQEFIVLFE
jgi:hypothetical protein